MLPTQPDPSRRNLGRDRGFTLIELMVSIVLVLILILGVNKVFQITTDTVGASQTFSEKVRDHRSIQSILAQDFRSALAYDGPCIIIDSTQEFAFRNANEARDDRDYDPTASASVRVNQIRSIDLNANNSEGENANEIVPVLIYNERNHRTDALSFFASGLYSRQTGNDGTYVSTTTRSEAWINYGHLRLFDGTGSRYTSASYKVLGVNPSTAFSLPSYTADTNPTNFYASQWVLGRNQMLMGSVPSPAPPTGEHYFAHGTSRTVPNPPLPSDPQFDPSYRFPALSPLAAGSGATTSGQLVQSSRYDLAGCSVSEFKSYLQEFDSTNRDVAAFNTPLTKYRSPAPPPYDWWTRLSYPFWASNLPSKPMTSENVAQTAPLFVAGCSQFIVEFAGDFIKQRDDGTQILQNGTALLPDGSTDPHNAVTGKDTWLGDGVIDFIRDVNGTKRIRWYGMPRDVASATNDAIYKGGPDGRIDPAYDVVPVRDLRSVASWFEVKFPTAGPVAFGQDYKTQTLTPNSPSAGSPHYFCAFGPHDMVKESIERPLLFRLTLTLDDPAGRLPNGQTYEYVVKLGL